MTKTKDHLYPIFSADHYKLEKERFLNQKAHVFWFTGLSGSGKSTLAQLIEKELLKSGYYTVHLDGDNIRNGISNNLAFSLEDRNENIRRIAESAKLFLNNGVIVLCSFISPTIAIRQMAENIVGQNFYKEIFINASLQTCESRDPKGIYKKVRSGEIQNFTGITSPYETPLNPFLSIDSNNNSIDASVEIILNKIINLISL